MTNKERIIAVIPAHLNSVRLPGKVMLDIFNIPMIEQVRRRVKLSKHLDDVFVATNSVSVKKLIEKNNGKVIYTRRKHRNGTSRVSEAIENVKCSHVIIVQGDEPLIDPKSIDYLIKNIKKYPNRKSWNFTAELKNKEELNKNSFVKCALLRNGKIQYFFRKSPSNAIFEEQKKYIKKVLGVLCFKKEILENYRKIKKSIIEDQEFIEQMSIIDNSIEIFSLNIIEATPSINEPKDINVLKKYLKKSKRQLLLSKKIGLKIN